MFAYNRVVSFSEWMNEKFVEWRGNTRNGVTDFANWVGISQPLMSRWMAPPPKNKVPRDQKTIKKLHDKFGDEVYDVLGLPRPASPSVTLEELMASVDPDRWPDFVAAVQEINRIIVERGNSITPPERVVLINQIFEKYSLSSKAIMKDPQK